jgi:hypothetical protein
VSAVVVEGGAIDGNTEGDVLIKGLALDGAVSGANGVLERLASRVATAMRGRAAPGATDRQVGAQPASGLE